ncbi:MAG: acyclic terpene utilization AtuA family protein [Acetobacterales bacterium]
MSAIGKLRDRLKGARRPLRALSGSGQLGYGVPVKAFDAGLARDPDFIGADMGSTDVGPYYLGAGELATAEEMTRRDLQRLLRGARKLDVPLLIGSAGTGGAAPHLEQTLAHVRDIAREDGMRFRMATIRADIPRDVARKAVRDGRMHTMGGPLGPLTEEEVDGCSQLVGQMGTEAFIRALEQDVDVVIAGRACDTAIYASIPEMLGYPVGPAMHMAKIVECASICCIPGGRDAMLATLDGDGFVLDSMNPDRHATPMSVAAHSLYEQADPFTVIEPGGRLSLREARYEKVDDHRTRVFGATWEPATQPTVKLEGATLVGQRAILVAGTSDPRFIGRIKENLEEVKATVADLVGGEGTEDYVLEFRVYGVDAVVQWGGAPATPPREAFIMGEVIAPSMARARTVAKTTKQFLLHHGFPGRLSTGGNLAFPFTPPELEAGPAYRFSVYHVMEADDLPALFPVEIEEF